MYLVRPRLGSPLSALSAFSALAALAALVVGACTTFSDPGTSTSGADGGADSGAGEVVARDVRVVVERPTAPALDPSSDSRASKIRVVITDTTDAGRTKEVTAEHRSSGPFELPQLVSSALVDVVVELTAGDGRLLGYAHAKPWDLRRDTTITVALRRRLVYFVSDTTPTTLRMIDLAPAAKGEPGMVALDEELDSLPEATALAMTRDGRTLVEAGASTSPGKGALAVFDTTSNARAKTLELPFVPVRIALLDADRTVLAYPGRNASTTVMTKIDLASGDVEPIPSGFTGGTIVFGDAFASFDGSRAYAVGSYDVGTNAPPKGYLVVHRVGETPTTIELPDVNIATGVRLTPDGSQLVVTGHTDLPGAAGNTGRVFVYHPTPTVPQATIVLAADKSATESVIVSGDGRRAYVTLSTLYPGTGACCGDFVIVDIPNRSILETVPFAGTGPEYAFASALQLPYEPQRLFAGQTDPGNNVHPEIVEIVDGQNRPRDVDASKVYNPTVVAMASPFAQMR